MIGQINVKSIHKELIVLKLIKPLLKVQIVIPNQM